MSISWKKNGFTSAPLYALHKFHFIYNIPEINQIFSLHSNFFRGAPVHADLDQFSVKGIFWHSRDFVHLNGFHASPLNSKSATKVGYCWFRNKRRDEKVRRCWQSFIQPFPLIFFFFFFPIEVWRHSVFFSPPHCTVHDVIGCPDCAFNGDGCAPPAHVFYDSFWLAKKALVSPQMGLVHSGQRRVSWREHGWLDFRWDWTSSARAWTRPKTWKQFSL